MKYLGHATILQILPNSYIRNQFWTIWEFLKGKSPWQACDSSVYRSLMADMVKNYQSWVADLLDGDDEIRVLVYAGDVDYLVNYLGCEAWPLRLDWRGKKGYNSAEKNPWKVGGKPAGLLRSYKNLAFLQVFQAGHMVPMDKPKEALEMLNSFIFNAGV